jgi:putative ABC transport system substrate-binding protein
VRRREFITLIGGAAAVPMLRPLAAHAQQPGKLPTIGYSGANTALVDIRRTSAFVLRMRELGWIENRTVAFAFRWAEGRNERFAEIAAEFVRLKVDVIVAGAAGALAAKEATSVIPIVFAGAADPVGVGLVASLARPGGNLTGLSLQNADLAGKRVELLREIVPGLRRLAVLANAGNPNAMPEMREAQAAARKFGLEALAVEIRHAADIAPVLDALKGRADALYVCGDPLVATNRKQISAFALGARLPTLYVDRESVADGGLISYGTDFSDQFRRAADFVDKILRGAKPGDLPVEQPTKFDLIINLTTAKALGLKIPEAFLLRADEVIE